MNAQERVLERLKKLCNDGKTVTAQQLAEDLKISRQNVSHYLNELLKKQLVQKQNTRPVLWMISSNKSYATNFGTFSDIIGSDGSLRNAIEQCISAVNYPPNGLSLLIQGASGSGKSFLAKKIADYAMQNGNIEDDAPFITLNCADYADNPELLSSTLFGYKRGAFTGAERDKKGLLAAANHGFLFLDEVHRLSSENQEKLFLFMDSGRYRPIGENNEWSQANVRLIFATTENINKYFLETFLRRIDVKIALPTFANRPINERLELIRLFFLNEAHQLKRTINVKGSALALLANCDDRGNVGKVKSVIKLACARSFSLKDEPILQVNEIQISNDLDVSNKNDDQQLPDLLVDPDRNEDIKVVSSNIDELTKDLINHYCNGSSLSRMSSLTQKLLVALQSTQQLTQTQLFIQKITAEKWKTLISKRYGVVKVDTMGEAIGNLVVTNFQISDKVAEAKHQLTLEFLRSAYLAQRFVASLDGLTIAQTNFISSVVTVVLAGYVQEKMPVKGLLIAHGERTASSIGAVVNQLCGNYIFEAIDMPIDSDVNETVELTRQYIDAQVHAENLVLIVDMGSLNQLYSQIKNDLQGELLIVNNLTTAIALDIGLKMQSGAAFEKIASDTEKNYRINVQYFDGFAKKSNIIISCMSGLGISEKLKEIFQEYLGNQIDIYTKDYRSLRELIKQNDNDYFAKTKLVITTSALPRPFNIPYINIYDILDPKGTNHLADILKDELSPGQFNSLISELVRFFSIEGVADRLNFLNPQLVINEVETVVSKYETIFKLSLTGTVKLNLYMHIALMMERLFLARNESSEDEIKIHGKKEEDFFIVSNSIFQPMEMKYHFKVNSYEISLLFEILQPFIEES